jgi:hypothetical protein
MMLRRSMNQAGASDFMFVAPLIAFIFACLIVRQAIRVSAQGGYPLWSLRTVQDMSQFLPLIGVGIVAVIAATTYVWIRNRRNSQL